jgi:AraC-like DNA-binding protein
MKHWYVKPHELLTPYVRTVLLFDGSLASTAGSLPVFTNGLPALFLQTKKNKEGFENILQLALYGKSPGALPAIDDDTTLIIYFFSPFTLPALFAIAANKLSDIPINLASLNPQQYLALQTQISYASDTSGKTKVLDNLLLQQISENQRFCEIVNFSTSEILARPEKDTIPTIIETLGLNERTFQRIFKKYVGVTATQYRRTCQFQGSFGQLRGKRFDATSEVAYDNGYADQSHFIRSFREFTDTTPKDYLKSGLKNK